MKSDQSSGVKEAVDFSAHVRFHLSGRCQCTCLESVEKRACTGLGYCKAGWSGQSRGQSGQLVHWVRRGSDREAQDFKPRQAQ